MLYPNPAQNELIIDASKTSSESTLISITDITGKIIYETALNPSKINIVNLIDFASGVYQVRMATSQGFTVKQFVKK
jgi:hypothetical protein